MATHEEGTQDEKKSPSKLNLLSIPNDCLVIICAYLDLKNILKLTLMDKELKKAIDTILDQSAKIYPAIPAILSKAYS